MSQSQANIAKNLHFVNPPPLNLSRRSLTWTYWQTPPLELHKLDLYTLLLRIVNGHRRCALSLRAPGEGNCGQPEIRKASQFPSYGPAWHIAVLRATILAGEASQSAPGGPETPILMRREFRVDAGPSHLEWFSPRCRTGSRVLRARTRVAVRHRPISAPGAPQPSTQSVGTGLPCAYLATCGGSAPPKKKQQRPTPSAGLRSSGTTSNRGLKKVTVGPAVRSWKLLQVNGQQFAAEAVES